MCDCWRPQQARQTSEPGGVHASLLTLQETWWTPGVLLIKHLAQLPPPRSLPLSFCWGKVHLCPREGGLTAMSPTPSPPGCQQRKQSNQQVLFAEEVWENLPLPPPAGSAHRSATQETTNTTLVISSLLPAADGLHKKNPWTSDYFLKRLSPQISQQTFAGRVPARAATHCSLQHPATFPRHPPRLGLHVFIFTSTGGLTQRPTEIVLVKKPSTCNCS